MIQSKLFRGQWRTVCCQLLVVAAVVILGLTTAAPAHAQQVPGPHPAYLHALGNLRAARAYLAEGFEWDPVRREDERAIQEIDAAIREIKIAAIDDGKNLNDHPAFDHNLSPHNRFAKANELLSATHQDLAHAEDVPQARGLRDRAIRHVDEAHNTVDHAVEAAHWM